MMMSAHRTMSVPPPMHQPCTAAIVGFAAYQSFMYVSTNAADHAQVGDRVPHPPPAGCLRAPARPSTSRGRSPRRRPGPRRAAGSRAPRGRRRPRRWRRRARRAGRGRDRVVLGGAGEDDRAHAVVGLGPKGAGHARILPLARGPWCRRCCGTCRSWPAGRCGRTCAALVRLGARTAAPERARRHGCAALDTRRRPRPSTPTHGAGHYHHAPPATTTTHPAAAPKRSRRTAGGHRCGRAGRADRRRGAQRSATRPATPRGPGRRGAWLQQVAYRSSGDHPEWDAEVLVASRPNSTAASPRNSPPAASSGGMATKISDTLPAWRIIAPAPPATLLGYYQEAEATFGVPWQYLAAINLVETGMGRITGLSVAGAQGPMQFMPATWEAFGDGGDVHNPRDAILGAARYLAHNGMRRGQHRGRAVQLQPPLPTTCAASCTTPTDDRRTPPRSPPTTTGRSTTSRRWATCSCRSATRRPSASPSRDYLATHPSSSAQLAAAGRRSPPGRCRLTRRCQLTNVGAW